MRQSGRILTTVFFVVVVLVFIFSVNTLAAEVTYDDGDRRDPFKPVTGGEGADPRMAGSFVLSGIVYDPPAKSLAVIGGEPYKVGDTVGKGKIVEIQKTRVTIDIDGEVKTLWIEEEPVQKTMTEA